jgi:H+-translocating NAD(P) transhydrogenase subunit alpha
MARDRAQLAGPAPSTNARLSRHATAILLGCQVDSRSEPITQVRVMNSFTFLQLYVFVLAGFVGYQVITRVPALLHTPMMSATNAISGISLVGSIVAAGSHPAFSKTLGFFAVTAATINVVGGFMITDRMLKMFKRKEGEN